MPSGGSRTAGARGAFENEYGDQPVEFAQFGINVTVLEPGQTGFYHAESNQEAFLVLSGECRLLVEGEERRLQAWDFFHSPGTRSGPEVRYPVSELAARYAACVAEETSDPEQAYANVEWFRRQRPPYWNRLPWA